MQVASSSGTHGAGSAPSGAGANNSASSAPLSTMRSLTVTPDSDSLISGSTSSTVEPECSTMYETSPALSR